MPVTAGAGPTAEPRLSGARFQTVPGDLPTAV